MNARTIVIALGAALALTLPAAASARSTHESTMNRTKSVAVKTSSKSAESSKSVSVSTPSASQHVIYIDIQSAGLPSAPDPNACQDNGSNCSPLGACAYFAVGCDSLSPADQATLLAGDLTPANTTEY